MTKKTLRDIDVTGKTVLVRVDYNVPIEDGVVGDALRIKASFETIRYLQTQNCQVILMSHLGRPDGKRNPKLSLGPVAIKAARLLRRPIDFVPECVGLQVEAAIRNMRPGHILLLENLRFHPEEEANDLNFAKALASLADIYVDDAFATIHRAHASTVGVTKYLPSVAGFLVEHEYNTITLALEKPRRPLMALIGGAKISSKMGVLGNLLEKVDIMCIGGAMANTFLAAQGLPVGKSIYEPDQLSAAQKVREAATARGVELILPIDLVVAHKVSDRAKWRVVEALEVEADDIIVDIGPKTIERILKPVRLAGTIIWNGPLDISEIHNFAHGSLMVARGIVDASADSIAGGGDTAAFIDGVGLHDRFNFVSTGGGASLDLMAGKKLPGVEALLDKPGIKTVKSVRSIEAVKPTKV